MSIIDSDIVVYCSAVMPENDATTSIGGAIDPLRRAIFTDLSSNGAVKVSSNGTSDGTKTLTVTGRLPDGTVTSDVIAISATANQFTAGVITFERLLKLELSVNATGAITIQRVSDSAVVAVIPSGERGVKRIFYNSTSSPVAAKTVYDKVFYKNTNPSSALLTGVFAEDSDPQSNITFALADTVDDSGVSTNRLTAPSGVSSFSGDAKAIPGDDLQPGEAIGVWFKQEYTTGQAGYKTTYSLLLTGSSA